MKATSVFHLDEVLKELTHYLPQQAPLKDFIHHNTLHAFQNHEFFEGLKIANRTFGYSVSLSLCEYRDLFHGGKISELAMDQMIQLYFPKSNVFEWKYKMLHVDYSEVLKPNIGRLRQNWKSALSMNIDSLTHPLLFRILGSYLDQGISIWNFPHQESDFLTAIREIDKQSYVHFFSGKLASSYLQNESLNIVNLLQRVVGDETLFEQYLFDQQFAHPGWSGMVSTIERNPQTVLKNRKISLKDLIIIELLIEIDVLESKFGPNFKSVSELEITQDLGLWSAHQPTEIDHVKQLWQLAYEFTYYNDVLKSIEASISEQKGLNGSSQTDFQAIFCIDDRECSIRRHLEQVNSSITTFGTPGFFGVEFYYQPKNGLHYTKHCPAPIDPKYLIKEVGETVKKSSDIHFHKHSHSLIGGWILTHTYGFWSAVKLILSVFKPKMGAAVTTSLQHMDEFAQLTIEHQGEFEKGLQIGFTPEQMADRLEALLRSIGLTHNFAPLVYVIGHGSSSVNNPHYAAYDCGACSGRPGSVNARVLADIANRTEVRNLLLQRGIVIPEKTKFIGGLQDTTRDEFKFYDIHLLDSEFQKIHQSYLHTFEVASRKNAVERSRRFELINSGESEEKIFENVKLRSVSLFEPRSELNHATNALCVVGRRSMTRNLFLDRRAFLNSYDYSTDSDGTYLLGILKAIAPVCGGINLEYYFSRTDNSNLGAGSKLPHNVMGLIGVANGIDGDLRTGLPSQMIEVHDPIRLLVIVEHNPEIVKKIILKDENTYNWFINQWIHLVVLNPKTQNFHLFYKGDFIHYVPKGVAVKTAKELESIFCENHGNLPTFILN